MLRVLPEVKLTPLEITAPAPFIERLRKVTTAVLGVAEVESSMLTALTAPLVLIPENVPPPSIVIDLSIVTGPKSPAFFALISPPARVCRMAAAKVWQGKASVQGFASLPSPATHVREDSACATVVRTKSKTKDASTLNVGCDLFMVCLPVLLTSDRGS